MGRGLPGRYHGFRQWAEQGGGGRHGDDGAEPEGSEVDVETRLAALVQTVVSQEAGGQDITAQPSIVLWLTRRQRAGIIWSSTRRLQWCLSRSCQKLSKVVKSCQKLSKVVVGMSESYVHHTRYKSDQFSDSSGDMSGSVGDFKASLMSQSSL